MEANRFLCGMTLVTAFATGPRLAAQVETEEPPVISGAKPVTFEGIKVRGTALEGKAAKSSRRIIRPSSELFSRQDLRLLSR
jgi:hypothetical protein